MPRSKVARGPVDPKTSLHVTLQPWTGHSVVTVDVGSCDSTGRHVSRLAYWHVALTRSDLHGKSSDDVLRLLCQCLLRRLESGASDPADQVAGREQPTAVGPGAPVGATGATVTQDCLPGI